MLRASYGAVQQVKERMREKSSGRIYRSQAEAVVQVLVKVLLEGRYADREIEYALRSDRRRGAADRAFIASSVYAVVRFKRLYAYVGRLETVHDATDIWRLLGVHVLLSGGTLPPWEEFSGLDFDDLAAGREQAQSVRAVRESIPDWLDALGEAELSEQWDAELSAMNTEAPVVLRVNTLKTDRQALCDRLERENGLITRPVAGCPEALELLRRANVFASAAFSDGWFELQDASSQRVSRLLAPEPGMRVVDACAGAGGKTLHLAALMQGRGTLLAMDVYGKKLDELRRRARRAGVCNVETRLIESTKTVKRLEATADRLLLDVPCSGLGTLRRNPDAKWKLSLDFIERVTALQAEILSSYSRMLKPGGRMVYSTCSVLPRENQAQVMRFLSEHPDFRLLEQHSLLSSLHGYDGFYMALLERGEGKRTQEKASGAPLK